MRADRLLSILMLLQAHGKMTAGRLARELEVSERTIYRDMDALSIAGVPVYSDSGPQGGYALVDDYRTTLTGLTAGEARALFMLSIPAPLRDLGVGRELRTALQKLSASLPNIHRRDEEKIRQRFYLDSTWWRQAGERVPHLQAVQQAVWENRKLHIVYRPLFADRIERCVNPLGLVAKAGIWYLVYSRMKKCHVQRVSELLDVHLSEVTFDRPVDFDLSLFWEDWCAQYESFLVDFTATVRVAPGFIPVLPRYFGNDIHARIAQAESNGTDGWIEIDLPFESFEAAREKILGFGGAVEVLAPQALRLSVQDFAEQIFALYG